MGIMVYSLCGTLNYGRYGLFPYHGVMLGICIINRRDEVVGAPERSFPENPLPLNQGIYLK